MRSIAERLLEARRQKESLNHLIFTEDEEMIPTVRSKVLEIVEEFLKYIQVEIRVLDIRLVGSNAAYNYTPNSDLDIHIVTDLSDISDPEIIARLYFDAIKSDFKDAYDIKIKGIDVELYVEDVNTAAISNGIYSVSNDEWIKHPKIVDEPDNEDEVEEIVSEITQSIKKCKTKDEVQSILDKLYIMRKDSLAKDGETGVGNLAFKSLRDKGILDSMKKVMKSATSRELSLESLETKFF